MSIDLKALLIHSLALTPGEFAGKVVVVTGAGRGIGQQAARAFALLGASVVVAELSPQGQAAAQEICAAGGKALFVQTDVSDSASVGRLAEATHQAFGPADIVVNNAIRIAVAPAAGMPEELWDQIIAVNLGGTFRVSRAFLPDLLAHKAGTIINLVSTEAMPGLSAYIASKQGILGFSQSLALEVGSAGIQVIPFAPGMVDTPGIRDVSAELAPHLGLSQEQFLKISLHAAYEGFMPPEHAGAATAYLAARLAQAYHGQLANGYEVLEQAGLLERYSAPMGPQAGQTPPPAGPQTIERVLKIIAQTGQEFEITFPSGQCSIGESPFDKLLGVMPSPDGSRAARSARPSCLRTHANR